MARYDGILLCSDFDGTLFCKDKISKENGKAIKYFQDNGGLFTIVSGRFPEDIMKRADRFMPNTYVIGLNGAVIFDHNTGKRIYKNTMPEGTQQFAEKVFNENPEIKKIGFHSFDTYYPFTRVTWQGGVMVDDLTKILYMVDEKDSDSVTEKISKMTDMSKYSVSRSWITCIELLSAESTKGRSVRRLSKMLGKRAELLVCVGDYENDISMIKEADIGYAVGNAAAAVKAVADRVTVPYDQHAIERIISEL